MQKRSISEGSPEKDNPPKKQRNDIMSDRLAPQVIKINDEGKMEINFDAVIPSSSFATLPSNIREIRRNTDIQKINLEKKPKTESESQKPARPALNEHFDRRLGKPRAVRQITKKFKFTEPGQIIDQAEKLRKQAQLDTLKFQIQQAAKSAGLEADLELVNDHSISKYVVPSCEWWDSQFLPNQTYGDLDDDSLSFDTENVTELIHHPVPLDIRKETAVIRPLMLSAKEIKKARRLRRLEEQKQKQEKIRLGLLSQEEPKLKLSNFLRVLGDEAFLDPTAAESKVREQMKQRVDNHVLHNLSRKLTDEQRSEKNRLRFVEDTSIKVQVAAFRVFNLNHPSHRFKVERNAQQLNLTGIALIHEGCNLVIVEGGPKGIAKYKNLMMRRINWSEERSENKCLLIWEGAMKENAFPALRIRDCPTSDSCKQMLGSTHEHLWDLAKSFT